MEIIIWSFKKEINISIEDEIEDEDEIENEDEDESYTLWYIHLNKH